MKTKAIITQEIPVAVAPRSQRRVPSKADQIPAKGASRRNILKGLSMDGLSTSVGAVQATVKLDVASMSAGALFIETRKISEGLNGNLFYGDLPEYVRTDLGVSVSDLQISADNLAAAEQTLRSARAAQQIVMGNARNSLRTAATACETEDRSEEALVSVGWNVRRPAGRPKPVPAPRTVAMKNTTHEGQVEARWPRIPNAHFYELRSLVSIAEPDPNIWDTLPTVANGLASYLFKDLPVAQYLSVRVRAVGSKGPSAWSEASVIRVN